MRPQDYKTVRQLLAGQMPGTGGGGGLDAMDSGGGDPTGGSADLSGGMIAPGAPPGPSVGDVANLPINTGMAHFQPPQGVLPPPSRAPGGIKKLLLNLTYNLGENISHSMGMQSFGDIQQKDLQNSLAVQKARGESALQQAQIANLAEDNRRMAAENAAKDAARAIRPETPADIIARKQQEAKAGGLNPTETLEYVYGIKHDKPDTNLQDTELAMRAAQGDPIAIKAMELMAAQKRAGRPQVNVPVGTLQLHQLNDGTSVLFNTKTGEVKPAKGMLTTGQAKDVNTAYIAVQDSQSRLNKMQNDYAQIQKNPANAGSYDMDLLSNHIAMTFGTVKGMRTGRDLIQHHLTARSLPEDLAVIAERVLNGGQLSDAQRQNFIHLGQATLTEAQRKHGALKRYYSTGETGNGNGAPTTPGWEGIFNKSRKAGAR